MFIAVSDKWIATCKEARNAICHVDSGWLFKVLSVQDFGSRGKMYKVEVPYGNWTVWSIRGVTEFTDEETIPFIAHLL